MEEEKQENSVNTAENKELNYSDNIFKELSWELDFWKEEVKQEEKQPKDKKYYLQMTLTILWVLNIFLFIMFVLSFLYVKAQNNEENYSKSFLDPFCFVILWSLQDKNTWDFCSSITSLVTDYGTKTSTLKNEILSKLSLVTWDLYTIENFVNSKEVSFLMSNKMNKLKVLDILNDFDRLKNDFSAWDKKLVNCKTIKINWDNTLDMTCEIYSSSWERVDNNSWLWIVWDTWDRKTSLIEWTSITQAASFINFIEKNSSYNFQIINKQKIFDSEVVWEWPYVKKTKVELKLKYNNLKNNLSL